MSYNSIQSGLFFLPDYDRIDLQNDKYSIKNLVFIDLRKILLFIQH